MLIHQQSEKNFDSFKESEKKNSTYKKIATLSAHKIANEKK